MKRKGYNSSQLESKIKSGLPEVDGKLVHVASLQVEGRHVCTAGIIYWDLLITSASCACYLMLRLKNDRYKPTAVLGSIELTRGHIYIIQSVKQHSDYVCFTNNIAQKSRNYKYDVGIVRLNSGIYNGNALILPLHREEQNARSFKSTVISGWGTTDQDDSQCTFKNLPASSTLHYMKMKIRSFVTCSKYFPYTNFKTVQMCGIGANGQKTTKGDIGSVAVGWNEVEKVRVLGIVSVVTDQWEDKEDAYTRFVRISSVHEEVSEIIKLLKPDATGIEGFTICQPEYMHRARMDFIKLL